MTTISDKDRAEAQAMAEALASWTYETTASALAPAPDPRIQVVIDWTNEPPATSRYEDALDLLTRLDNLKAVEYSEPNSN